MPAFVTITTKAAAIRYASNGGSISVTAGQLSGAWGSVIPTLTRGKPSDDVALVQQSGTAAMRLIREGWDGGIGAVKSLMWSAVAMSRGYVEHAVKLGDLDTNGTRDAAKVAAHTAWTEAAARAVLNGAAAELVCEVRFSGRVVSVLVVWQDGKPTAVVREGSTAVPFSAWNGAEPLVETMVETVETVVAAAPVVRRGRPRKTEGADAPTISPEAFTAWCRSKGGWAAAARFVNERISGATYRDTQLWSWGNPGKTSKARAVPAPVRSIILADTPAGG